MKTILLWDPRLPDRSPVRLTVPDDLASAAVRAGVAAAADPAQAGALSAGGPLDPAGLIEVALQHGASGNRLSRVRLPYSVAVIGAGLGVLAGVGAPIPGSLPPAPAPTLSLSAPVALPEGDSGTTTFSWTLTLTRNGSTSGYPFTWSVSSTGGNPADAADFGGTLPSGGGTFAPGETVKTITVLVTGDAVVEPNETFALLAEAIGVGSASSTGTINNDDAAGTAVLPLNAYMAQVSNSKGQNAFGFSMIDYFQVLTGGKLTRSPWSRLSLGGDAVQDYAFPKRWGMALAAAKGGFLWLGDDTNQVVKSGVAETASETLAFYRTMLENWIVTNGGWAIVELTARITNMPIGGSTDLKRQAVNNGLIGMAQEAQFGGRLRIADLTVLDLSDASISRDGTHYTYFGAEKATEIVAAAVGPILPVDPVIPASGDLAATADGRFGANVNTAYAMADANVDGTADNHTFASASGATYVRDFATVGGKRRQRVRFSGSATSATASDTFARVGLMTASEGEIWEMLVPFDMSNGDYTADPVGTLGLAVTFGTGSAWGATIQTGSGSKLAKMAGVLRTTTNYLAPGGTASTIPQLAATFAWRHQVGAVDSAFLIGEQLFMRRIIKPIASTVPFDFAGGWNRPSDNAAVSLFQAQTIANSSGTLVPGAAHVAGHDTIAFQWDRGGVDISGATNRYYTHGGVAGTYTRRATYTNSATGQSLVLSTSFTL